MELNGKTLMLDFTRLSRLFSKIHVPKVWQGELMVLVYLEQRAGKSTLPLDIKKALDLTSARVSAILNTLEKKGYIVRIMAPGDRRKVVVEITREGMRYCEKQIEDAAILISPIITRMGHKDTDAFIRLVHKLTDILEEMEQEQK